MSCNVILGQYETGDPIRCDENPDPERQSLHVHLWARDKVTGSFRGDYHYLGLYPRTRPETGTEQEIAAAKEHNASALAEKAEHERKVAERAKADAIRHPDIEWVPMSSEKFNRPPDPPKSAEQVATETKHARLTELRQREWSKLTLLEQKEATDLAFQLGETVPAITAVA